MVVIEPEEIDKETTGVKDQSKQLPPSPSSFKAEDLREETLKSAAGSANGDASDGFETASERGVSDEEDGDETIRTDHDRELQQQQARLIPETGQQKEEKEQQEKSGESCLDASNDEESKQKALTQANDAKLEGNKLYGEDQYEEALSKYELALQVAPDVPASVELRSICCANRAICFLKLGKYEETIKECTKALELNPLYVKALVRRGEAHEKLEHYEEAIADLKKVLELEPSNDQARRSIRRLEPIAEEKREKMKEEMIGKLKEMGNSILGRFGMSVDNFKAVKDPNTGSYSISFQK